LNGYKGILQKHHELYGKKAGSGVFLCSTNSYRKLSKRWSRDDCEDLVRRDFGILGFGSASEKMYATLDRNEFGFRLYNRDDVEEAGNLVVEEQFERLRRLECGVKDLDSGVWRWSSDWHGDSDRLASVLDKMFHDRARPVRHLVLLRPDDSMASEFPERLYKLAFRFASIRDALRINNVKVNTRWDSTKPVVDGRYSGVLLVDSQFSYCFELEFRDAEALYHYYQHEIHSVEREALYCALNPSVRPRFKDLEAIPLHQSQRRAEFFAQIEREMVTGGFIRRIDVCDEEPLSSVVRRGAAPVGNSHR
jgi:hypothetical protein